MPERLYILDAHSLIYQVFHAIPEMTSPSGMPTNAVFGFVRDILFLRRDKRPDYLVCSFDTPGPTFRHKLYADYKAHRPEMPGDLKPQIGMIRRALEAFRIPILAEPGFEADDFLASVAVEASRRKINAYLCTADKDVRQVVGDHAVIFDIRRGRVIDADYVVNDWGIKPQQVVDYQSMVGDSTDNVPGIAGVGAKTASKLLQKYGTFEAVCEHIDEIHGNKLKENLYKGRQSALLSRSLVKLRTDLPLPENWDGWRLAEPDRDRLLELFAEFGFHRFSDEIRAEQSRPRSDWDAQYVCINDDAGLQSVLERLADAQRVSVDLETTSLRPTEAQIVGVALAFEPKQAYYIAVRGPAGSTSLDPQDVLDKLKPALEDPSLEKVGQNLKYDVTVLRNAGIRMRGLAFDTMIASYLLEPGERNHNLDELSLRFLDHETIKITELIGTGMKRGQRVPMDQVPLETITNYAGEDADVALRLTDVFEPKIEREGLARLFNDVECPLVEVLAEMEFHGIRVDVERLARLSGEFAARLEQIREQVFEAAGRQFNLDSPTQLRVLLFDEIGLPVLKRTKSGPSTDQDVLEQLAADYPLCALLIEYRKLSKLKGTYVDSLPLLVNPHTGRIHASFNQAVAATGRLSSSDPNLQNIPIRSEEGQQIRQAFLPADDDHVLLSADYSQIELRMLAHFSGDENLKRAFIEGLDIHTVVAARIAGVSNDRVTSAMRRQAKAVNFGIMYGLSPFGLARQLGIDKTEAAEFIDAYFEQYPGIDTFFTKVLEQARKHRFVSTILGRKRPITGIKNTTGRTRNLPERTAINTVIQGSAADLIKIAMVAIHRRLTSDDFQARMLLQIHDELLFEVAADHVEPLARMVNEEMTTALSLDGVPLTVDLGIGPNWLDLTPIDLQAVPA